MSASTPPEPTSTSPAPSLQTLDTIGAQVDVIDSLLALAHQSVRVFDVDMSQMAWNSAKRAAAVTRFLRGSRDARLEVIVHDTRHLERECPRLLDVLRQFSAVMSIRRTGAEARSAMDPLLMVDARHFLHRYHVGQPRATLAIEQPVLAAPLVRRFEELWATGEAGLGAGVTGL